MFIPFAGLFYLLATFLWGYGLPMEYKPNINYKIGSIGHMNSRLSEVGNYSDVDILFLGSSHAYRGFDTRIFSDHGYHTFNLGSSSQTPIQTKILLERYLDKLNPKMVIYEMYPETFMIDGVESTLDLIANDRIDKLTLGMVLKINNIKTYNTLLYALVHNALRLNEAFEEPRQKEGDIYIQGGFVEKEEGYDLPVEQYEKKKIILDEGQVAVFSDIVHELKTRNIEVILVYAPIPHSNYDRYLGNEYYDSIMKGYSAYYNFNGIEALTDSLNFYDSHHLNQNGVKLFNNKLLNVLDNR